MDKYDTVYFITCVQVHSRESIVRRNEIHEKSGSIARWDPDRGLGRVNKRTWAFTHSLEDAIEMVEENNMDMYETSYKWAFIEGLYPLSCLNHDPKVQLIYEWVGDHKTGGYQKIDGWPEELETIYERIVKVMTSVG